jgi:hypothetical protein
LLLVLTSSLASAGAQTPAAQPDVMILNDGERVIGPPGALNRIHGDIQERHAWRAFGGLEQGEELHSSGKFAVIPKNAKLKTRQDAASVLVGAVTVQDQTVQLSQPTNAATAQRPLPLSGVSDLVDQAAFEKAFRRTSFLSGWAGGATGGITLTEATQKNQTFTGAINAVRAVPDVSWLDVRNRTSSTLTKPTAS